MGDLESTLAGRLAVSALPADAKVVVIRINALLSMDEVCHIKDTAQRVLPEGMKVIVIAQSGEDMWPLEWWTDADLARVGLQRVPEESS